MTIDGDLTKYPDFVCKKKCNICAAEFIDNTKNRSKKSCSPECRRKFQSQESQKWNLANKEHYNALRRQRRENGGGSEKDPSYYV